MTDSEHVHRFNGTLIRGHGRCACGVWAHWDRQAKAYTKLYDARYAKGLETRLRRLKDPDHHYPYEQETAKSVVEDRERSWPEYEAKTQPDVVQVFDQKRKLPEE